MIFIPRHMEHLDRHGGLPMPEVIVRRSIGRVKLAPSLWPGADLETVWEGLSGPPDFGKYDEARTRECIHGRWCHVCGQARKHLLVACPSQPQTRIVSGVPMRLLVQPWVCAMCLAYATRTCPPLRAAIKARRGMVFSSLDDAPIISTFYKPANPEDPVPPKGKMVVSAFKIAIDRPEPACQPMHEWAAGVANRHWRQWDRMAAANVPRGTSPEDPDTIQTK